MSGVRLAEPRDAGGIRAVHLAAFPTPVEADLVEALERDGDVVVSLVEESQGEIIGHVLLSRMRVSGDGRAVRALGLAPVGVHPGFQGAGIGGRLIEAALGIARATGEELVFVLGEPEYYRRHGFSTHTAAPSPRLMRDPISWPSRYRMGWRLRTTVRPPTHRPSPVSSEEMIARRLVIHGRVQGVSYRWWSTDEGRALGLDGWVRNRRDGTVEMVIAGDESAVARMIERCHEGPPAARVERVEVEEAAGDVPPGFEQRPTV